MESLTLVVMAAGQGRRYGGYKQIDSFGPRGWTLSEYAIHHALDAGFQRFVVVVGDESHDHFLRIVDPLRTRASFFLVRQSVRNLPNAIDLKNNRTKPWGTGHALWCAGPYLSRHFAVVNADDYYGAEAYRLAAQFLRSREEWGSVVYRLRDTLSPFGSVSRAVCTCGADSLLTGLKEYRTIVLNHNGGLCRDEITGAVFDGDELVSVNFWLLKDNFLTAIGEQFSHFLRENAASESAEFYLPEAVVRGSRSLGIAIRALPAQSCWLGVTYAEDREHVHRQLSENSN
jgi:hypothetical protein